jgi:hypothetical protein
MDMGECRLERRDNDRLETSIGWVCGRSKGHRHRRRAAVVRVLARAVAHAANVLGPTHDQMVLEAVRLFVRRVAPQIRKPRKKRVR